MSTNNTGAGETTSAQNSLSSAAESRAAQAPAPLRHAGNYDDAPPGVPGPDFSARNEAKPAFNRGPSMLDYTAVTSAGPTPANEVPNPMGSHMRGSRIRESHLPDEVDFIRRQTVTAMNTELPRKEPSDETRGKDEFGPSLSRQETETGTREPTSGWEGTNDTFGSHS